MKANELMIADLMIGDWVMLTDPIHNGEKVQVKEIHRNGYITVDGGIDNIFEPVPLTTEILEKNFPTTEDGVIWSETADGDLFNIRVEYDKYVEGIFKFVHELQHALRLCNIEKTIEL